MIFIYQGLEEDNLKQKSPGPPGWGLMQRASSSLIVKKQEMLKNQTPNRRFQSVNNLFSSPPCSSCYPPTLADTCTRQMSTVFRNLDMSGQITSQGHEVKVDPHILAAVTPDECQSSCVLPPLPALSAARTVTACLVPRRDAKCVSTVIGEYGGKK